MQMRPVLLFLVIFSTAIQVNVDAQDNVLEQLCNVSNRQIEKQFIKQSGRVMFNNAGDWHNWCGQVDRMRAGQIQGLRNILKPKQLALLGQKQQQMNNWINRQWRAQQMWLQQNAFGAMPFGGLPWNFRQPQVAYMPIVTWLPQGTQFTTNAVVSPDRRYVRMSLNSIFSSIGPIYHYNMNNGAYYRPNYGHSNSSNVRAASYNSPSKSNSNQQQIPAWYRKIRNNP
ncbi:MAG: hypothetical protein ACKVK0_06850 [Pirellulales bacterium]